MRTTLIINIPEPCHEDWNLMTPKDKGRHCKLCEKTVYDFTDKTDEQIVKTFQSDGNLCGRFKSSQLKRELVLSRKEKNNYLSFVASTLFAFLSIGTQELEAQGKPKELKVDKPKQNKVNGKMATSLFKQKEIVGKITKASDSLPLSGVRVFIKDKKQLDNSPDKGVQADADGIYKIKADVGDTLVFSNGGYVLEERIVSTRSQINVSLSKIHELSVFTLKGTVTTADDGLPLPGASVIVKGTTRGVQTDFDGNYVIEVKPGEILIVSYVGMITTERTVGVNDRINMAMNFNNDLEEVVVGGIMSISYNYPPYSSKEYVSRPYHSKDSYESYKNKMKVRYQTYRKFYKRKREEHREKIKNGQLERSTVGKLLHNITNIFRKKE